METPVGRKVSPWVKAWFAFHVVMISLWSLPKTPSSSRAWVDPNVPEDIRGKLGRPFGSDWILVANDRYFRPSWLSQYLLASGAWQYWDMFAPDPSRDDYWVSAEVGYQDGSRQAFFYPRMSVIPLPERFLKERFRKFAERFSQSSYPYLQPPVAQRIALLAWTDRTNPPVEVKLIRTGRIIQPPGQRQLPYSTGTFFTYAVDRALLDKFKEWR